MNRMNLRSLFIFLSALCLLLTGCAQDVPETVPPTVEITQVTEAITEPAIEPTTLPAETEPAEERFLLTFVGDCTLGSNPTNAYAGYGFIKTVGKDYRYPFGNVIGYFENDEATFLNLEGPLTDEGNPMVKKHTFRGPTDYINILTQNSVECVSIANNHTLDYGEIGYASTRKTLEEAGMPFAERDTAVVFTTENGLTIGVYGAVYYKLDEADMVAEIAALQEQGCDIIIYAPHWGVEGNYKPTSQQVDLGRAAIEAGAHIVWGSHPHVLEPVEEYGDGVIYYSLGNFSFGGNGAPVDYDTALIQQEIIRDGAGVRLGETFFVPCNVSSIAGRNNFQPTPYAPDSEEYARVLSKLAGDFDGPNAYGF